MMLDLAQNSPRKSLSKNTNTYHYSGQKIRPLPKKTHPCSILQVPTTQLAKMSIDLGFVELTADVLEIFFIKWTFWFAQPRGAQRPTPKEKGAYIYVCKRCVPRETNKIKNIEH